MCVCACTCDTDCALKIQACGKLCVRVRVCVCVGTGMYTHEEHDACSFIDETPIASDMPHKDTKFIHEHLDIRTYANCCCGKCCGKSDDMVF